MRGADLLSALLLAAVALFDVCAAQYTWEVVNALVPLDDVHGGEPLARPAPGDRSVVCRRLRCELDIAGAPPAAARSKMPDHVAVLSQCPRWMTHFPHRGSACVHRAPLARRSTRVKAPPARPGRLAALCVPVV
jgi:hypothetical protein